MELRDLRYFSVTAEELNITRAAERLNMSQPPLSNQIKGLEEELGVQLFIRGKRRLKLTDAGSLLYRRAQQILELTEQTELEMHSLQGLSGCINISLVEGRAPYLLSRWIAGFRAEFPQVVFRLWNGGNTLQIPPSCKGGRRLPSFEETCRPAADYTEQTFPHRCHTNLV